MLILEIMGQDPSSDHFFECVSHKTNKKRTSSLLAITLKVLCQQGSSAFIGSSCGFVNGCHVLIPKPNTT